MIRIGIIVVSILFATIAFSQVERVGGNYLIKKIEKKSDRYFQITFESVKKTGKFDRLVLDSDHVHFSVKEGQQLRISAEIAEYTRAEAKVSQVLLFLPHVQGYTPVWILSRNRRRSLRGSKFLEMHAPQSDYRIF